MKTYLRKSENTTQAEEGGCEGLKKIRLRNTSANTKVRSPHGGSYTGAGGYALKEPQPVESPHRSRFVLKDCSPWRGLTLEKSVKKNCYILRNLPNPHSPCIAQGMGRDRTVKNEGVKLTRARGEWGEGVV